MKRNVGINFSVEKCTKLVRKVTYSSNGKIKWISVKLEVSLKLGEQNVLNIGFFGSLIESFLSMILLIYPRYCKDIEKRN